ncbi:GNAT family N-acetyltransferase [Lachnoclostridium phytofermentans]|uniref:GCN5-related N-acetyltransferase n=1 Tax=Lachnoclostridium phytofermentans (strain ATCC 700394 / DSM 18823 / ISDg) TaxID=357809 RepID=A9KR63_LACP7|nr:GNAT family N-acetyltransferase [Lachnoclostridium phytofermentans]ABX40531.1 GCN5-related N-acetyltransferase [Lachnoclostridium phytofermentans ISDg]
MENNIKIQLRPYQTSDCKEMSELFYQTVHNVTVKDYSLEQRMAWANGNVNLMVWDESFQSHYTLVATDGTLVLGFSDIDATGYLDRLYVHKDYQGIGIATMLCDALEAYYFSNGSEKITTHASITAKPFFHKRGYQIVKEQQVIRGGISLTNYVMALEKENF